ncbi:tetratricopeptide repeat protein [Lacticaseibacillus nasuensis]|uniref:TPR repeats containing protein n=1 Tax=Lacticaseibacillus nasuensis JCM 17158 TaxID=1291734 RepID=A0A0R1JT38_9LACO|nr:tetratricopeptide repeat protein [Lacticaseibacillus nasuensis]KRK74398.1 tPR repeats containing protein [Lacticaseibacillus nasuensis JCM 17158]
MTDLIKQFNAGDHNAAIQAAVKEIDAHPKDPKRYATLATMLIAINDYDQATQLLVQALGLFPNDPELLYSFGLVAYAQDNAPLAIKYFAQLTGTAGALAADADYMLALCYQRQHNNQKALAFALTAKDADPTRVDAALLCAQLLLALGSFAQSAAMLEPFLAAKDARVLFQYGLAKSGAGADGSPWLAEAKRLDPKHYDQQANSVRDIAGFLKASEPDA